MEFSTALTFLAAVSVPVITVFGNRWLKRTPEASQPEQYALETLKAISSDLKEERENRIAYQAKTDEKIEGLKEKVEELWQNTVHLKRHIVELETELCENNLAVPERPPEVQAIFG